MPIKGYRPDPTDQSWDGDKREGRTGPIRGKDGASTAANRATFGYPGAAPPPETVAMKVLSRAHSITVSLEIPSTGAEGVIVSHGNASGGYALFIQDTRLHYVHNHCGALEQHVVSAEDVPVGRVRARVEFEPTSLIDAWGAGGAPGRTRLYIDNVLVADKEFPVTIPLVAGSGVGLSVGRNPGSPVSRMYDSPFTFTGKIVSVRYDLSDRLVRDAEELRALSLARETHQ